MRIGKLFFLLLLNISTLFATLIDRSVVKEGYYSIKLGVFKKDESIENILSRFPESDVVIVPYKNRNHVYITNFKTRKSANRFLRKKVRKIFKDAYILKNRFKKRSLKVSLPKVSDSPVVSVCENNTTQPRQSIKKDENRTIVKKAPVKITAPEKTVQKIVKKPVNDQNRTKMTKKEETLTLHEAIMISLNRSRKILSQREKVIQQKFKVEEKRGAFKPNVTLYSTAGYNYTHTRADDDTEDKYPAADAQLSITENLYAGGKHSAELKREEIKLLSEAATFRDKVEEETLKIIEAYLDLYYQEEAIKIERENMRNLEKILEIVEIKAQNGAASQGDLSNIKSKVQNASTALVKATSRYENARSFYEYFLGKANARKKPAEGTFSFPTYTRKTIFSIFEKKNAKLLLNRYKTEAQKYDYQAKKAPFRPTVDLIVTGKEKFSKAQIDPFHDEKASVVLSMNYNLYKGGQDRAKMMQSKSKITQLDYQYQDILESTRYNLKQIFENIQASDDTLVHIQKEVESNKKSVEAYWNAFKYATVDMQTLLLAQRALNSSQQSLIKEKKNYILGHFKLLRETGELLEFLKVESFVDPEQM